jgi:hypothetical protein
MYGSVEMLLKFYAENFSFKFTGQESRAKSRVAHAMTSFKPKLSHWRSRHFTRVASDDRIHSALLDFSTNKFLNFSRDNFHATREGR